MRINKGSINLALLLALSCLVSFGSGGCTQAGIRNQKAEGRCIVCFGDSITFGYGAEQGEDYPSILAKMTGLAVVNAGIDGDTTVEALKRLDADVLQRDPFLVIVEFGGNDFLRKIPLETTVANLRQIVERIQAKGKMVALVDISAGMFLKEYRFAYGTLARSRGALFIPSILDKIITNPRMKSDFLHPNAEGYALIADRVLQFIEPYLAGRSGQQRQ